MSFHWFEVRNIDDPHFSGRCQVRAHPNASVDQSNETQVPDENLKWAMPLMPISDGPALNKAGTIPVGPQVGSKILCVFAENDVNKQYPIMLGCIPRAYAAQVSQHQNDSSQDSLADVNTEDAGIDTPSVGNPDKNTKGTLAPLHKVSPGTYYTPDPDDSTPTS